MENIEIATEVVIINNVPWPEQQSEPKPDVAIEQWGGWGWWNNWSQEIIKEIQEELLKVFTPEE